jgi:hypothetical protein
MRGGKFTLMSERDLALSHVDELNVIDYNKHKGGGRIKKFSHVTFTSI